MQALNREILMRMQEEGAATVSSTVLGGQYALRVALSNHRTRTEDLDFLTETVVRIGSEI